MSQKMINTLHKLDELAAKGNWRECESITEDITKEELDFLKNLVESGSMKLVDKEMTLTIIEGELSALKQGSRLTDEQLIKLELDDPTFWALIGEDESLNKKCAIAMKEWWQGIKPKLSIYSTIDEAYSNIYPSWESTASKFEKGDSLETRTGITDTVSRERMYLLLENHYGVSLD